MQFHILASGSKGNSTFIYQDGVGLLIDCGISKRKLTQKLEVLGFNLESIHYVLLTHDHSDHNKNIKIFNQDIIYTGINNIENQNQEQIVKAYEKFQLGCFTICPLPLSHDATSPFGFVIEGDQSLVVMTDTGYISKNNMKYMMNKNYYIIESNHDIEMLMNSNRPLFLKNRIYGDEGHLNNAYSAKIMTKLIGDQTKEIFLAHLSQDTNSPIKALETYQRIFNEHQIQFDQIKVASQEDTVSGGNDEN